MPDSLFGDLTARKLGPVLAAMTAVAGLLAAAPAQAVVVYSGAVNIAIPDNIDGLYFNVVTGASGTDGLSVSGWDINPYSAVAGNFNLWGPTTQTWYNDLGSYVVGAGTMIDGSALYSRPGGGTNVGLQVSLNAPNLFGFKFTNESLGVTNYGWVEITFGASAGERAITGYAYETSGGGIMAGVVPEPGTVALMLAGLAGVGAVARRRQRQDA